MYGRSPVTTIQKGKLDGVGSKDPRPGPNLKKDPAKFVTKVQYSTEDLDLLRQEITCKSICDEDRLHIMEQAVVPCPEIFMNVKGKQVRSLLDSGSVCTLMNESLFKEHIEHLLKQPSGAFVNSHNLFYLKGVRRGTHTTGKTF